jgi:hypothetical protein
MYLAGDSAELFAPSTGLATLCQRPLGVHLAPITHPLLNQDTDTLPTFACAPVVKNCVLTSPVPTAAKLTGHTQIVLAVFFVRDWLNVLRIWSKAARIVAHMVKLFAPWYRANVNAVRDYVGTLLHSVFVGGKPIPPSIVASTPLPATGGLYDLVVEPLLECFTVPLRYVAGVRAVALPLPSIAGELLLAYGADSYDDGHALSLRQGQKKVNKGVH